MSLFSYRKFSIYLFHNANNPKSDKPPITNPIIEYIVIPYNKYPVANKNAYTMQQARKTIINSVANDLLLIGAVFSS
jgi:hypothetical protein